MTAELETPVVAGAGTLAVLRNGSYLRLWLGLLVSDIGDWINYIAMAAVVYGQTRSVAALAVLRLFHIVPSFVVAPFAGVLIDRWSRHRTLVLAPLAAGAVALLLAATHSVATVFMAYGVITVALLFFEPCLQASMPLLVRDAELVAANALSQVTGTLSVIAGGLIGGLLVAQIGASAAFLLNGVSFVLVALAAGTVRLRAMPDEGEFVPSFRRELGEGLSVAWQIPAVGVVLVASTFFVFAEATVLTLGLAFVHRTLHASTAAYGEIVVGLGIGSLLASLALAATRDRIGPRTVFAVGGLLCGLGVAALGLSSSVLVAAISYGVAGFGMVAAAVAAATLVQRLVPSRRQGRVFALSSTLDHTGAFLNTLLIGVAGRLSPSQVLTASGGIGLVAGVGALVFMRLVE